jgi:hypothetical protein
MQFPRRQPDCVAQAVVPPSHSRFVLCRFNPYIAQSPTFDNFTRPRRQENIAGICRHEQVRPIPFVRVKEHPERR